MNRGLRQVTSALLATVVTAGLAAVVAAPAHAADGDVLVVQTVPPTEGARVSAEGNFAIADAKGVARLAVANWDRIDARFNVPETRVSEDRKVLIDRIVGAPSAGRSGNPVVVGLRTQRLVSWSFVDRGGQEVDPERITMLELRSNAGEIVQFEGEDLFRPHWLAAGRTQQTPKGLVNKEQYWNVTRVVVDGAEVVNSSQQVFFPEQSQDWQISLLFYRVAVVGRDLLFGGLAGKGVELVMPDGELVREEFDREGVVVFPSLPRGSYDVRVYGAGASFARPMSISRDQEVDIEVITGLDISLVVATLLMIAISLLVIGRRHRLPKLRRSNRGESVAVAIAILVAAAAAVVVPSAPARAAEGDEPAYAYFYIWYQPTSWLRAKSDYPLLGRYSSDDQIVMDRQVEMAQRAGLDGFIVSWKHTDTLDGRLQQLVRIAEQSDFELAVVYQGLDFERNPLSVKTISEDLTWFADQYATSPAFARFEKPVVAITGTELFSVEELREIRAAVGDRLSVLATAKSVQDYRRVAEVVDGDAYYWSSANPGPGWYTNRLVGLGDAVHADDDGLWFAPAAPGFDARLIGGTQVIERKDGETLEASVTAARASEPDVLALISWNEYSENSHLEPSEVGGTESLKTVSELLGGEVWLPPGTGLPTEERREFGLTGWGALTTLLLLFAALNLVVILLRPSGRRASKLDPGTPSHRADDPTTTGAVQ